MSDEPAFVDTNILVYAYAPDDVMRSGPARELIERLVAEGRFRTSTQALQELFVTLTRKLKKPAMAGEALLYLDRLAQNPICSVDYLLVRDAVHISMRSRISFWDGMIVAAAGRCGASVVYTEDLQHGQTIGAVRIVNPFRESI